MNSNVKDILLVFVSSANKKSSLEQYKILDISESENITHKSDGWQQTNEAGVYYIIEYLKTNKNRLPQKIFLIVSKSAAAPVEGIEGNKSPLQYFKDNIAKRLDYIEDVEGLFCEIPYDEDKDINHSIIEISDIANNIVTYAENNLGKNDNIKIHADMTGGFRHISMLILAVMQLLTSSNRFGNFSSGKVIYSNMKFIDNYEGTGNTRQVITVDDATEIYRTMSLISGADELSNFGSVLQLKKYFNEYNEEYYRYKSKRKRKNKNCDDIWIAECNKLIGSLDNFCETLKLCKSGEIFNSINKMKSCMENFVINTAGCRIIPIMLFKRLLDPIKNEYGEILKDNIDTIDIIKWCTSKDYLQQALTFCTELTPRYMVDNKYVYTDKDEVKNECIDFMRNVMHMDNNRINSNTIAKCLISDYVYIKYDNINSREIRLYQEKLFNDGVFKSSIERNHILDIIDKYRSMRDLRNMVNHASISADSDDNTKNNRSTNSANIKKRIEDYIDVLKNIECIAS